MKIPYALNEFIQDTSVGAWETHQTILTQMSDWLAIPVARDYPNRVSLLDRTLVDGKIHCFFYNGIAEGVPAGEVRRVKIATASMAEDAVEDLTTQFGVASWDVGKNYAGAASGNNLDDYTSPSIMDNFLIFSRSYTDRHGNARILVYKIDPLLDVFTLTDTIQSDFDNIPIGGFDVKCTNVFFDETGGQIVFRYNDTLHFAHFANFRALDVTPPYIIYRILTSDVFGFGFDTSRIDQTSYQTALAYCESEGFFVSVTYTNPDNMLSIIDELLALYGGYLIDDGGILRFGIVRPSDAPDSVVIDNSRLLVSGNGEPPVNVTKGAAQDGYNVVRVNYLDRNLDYKQNQTEIADEVDIDINGRRFHEFPATYVMAGSMAAKIAERALWTNLYGKDIYKFRLGGKDAHRQQGDVITLVDSWHPTLRTGVTARIVQWREAKRLEFDVTAVQVFSYQQTANHSFYNTTSAYPGDGLAEPIQPPLAQRMYEMPKEFQGVTPTVYVGYNQATRILGAQLHLSVDGGASYILAHDVQPYIISGLLPSGLENRPTGYCERDIILHLMPRSYTLENSPTWAQTTDLDDVTQALRAAGGGIIVCGSEAMALENLTLIDQNIYRVQNLYRGWGGSPISNHNSGEYWHYHQAGIFKHTISEDDIGHTFYYKVAPYNWEGQVCDLSSISAGTYQIKGLFWLPRYQPKTMLWVQSAINWPRSTNIGDLLFLNTVSGGCDTTLTWPAAANNEGWGAGGYGAQGYGHFIADVLTPSYRVNVYSSNGTVARSTVVYTGFFNYDLATNSTDFNGFTHNLWFKVTPYNIKGDGPVSDQRTLNLFW